MARSYGRAIRAGLTEADIAMAQGHAERSARALARYERKGKPATPPERNMIARRRWFSYRVPQIPQLGFVRVRRAKVQ
jgi:hypothetical protein